MRVVLKWSMGREENLAAELLDPVADWMSGWQNFLQPLTWEPARFVETSRDMGGTIQQVV